MTNLDLVTYLRTINACPEALEWLGDRDLATAWAACQRADWMLWLAEKVNISKRQFVRVAALCAQTAEKYTDDKRVVDCNLTALRWADGKATDEELKAAAEAAWAAGTTGTTGTTGTAWAAGAAWAAEAARATGAAWAAWAAEAARATGAAWAAEAARATGAAWDARVAAEMAALSQMADIVRANITVEDIKLAIKMTKP